MAGRARGRQRIVGGTTQDVGILSEEHFELALRAFAIERAAALLVAATPEPIDWLFVEDMLSVTFGAGADPETRREAIGVLFGWAWTAREQFAQLLTVLRGALAEHGMSETYGDGTDLATFLMLMTTAREAFPRD